MAGLLPDNLKQSKELSYYDFYDRIVNLKFTFVVKDSNGKETGEKHVFILRSDYEAYYPNLDVAKMLNGNVQLGSGGDAVVRKCVYKPSIKVNYKNVSSNTNIAIDVYVSNFYMFDTQGNRFQNINSDGYVLKEFEVAMGYFGQFEQLPHATVADLFNFQAGYNISILKCSTSYVTTESLPPDYTLHITGFVGQATAGRVYKDPKGYEKAKEKILTFEKSGEKSALEMLYFERVTRHFVKNLTEKGTDKTDEAMSDTDANKYGVRVFVTDTLNEISKEQLETQMTAADGSTVPFEEFTDVGETALNTLLAGISELLPVEVRYKPLCNGDFLAYSATETDNLSSLLAAANVVLIENKIIAEDNAVKLPAVYNITFQSGLCQITAPYYGLYDFGTKVDFRSRYILGDLVAYFKGNVDNVSVFWIYEQEVSFATNDNVNQCVMNLIKEE